MSDEDRPEHIEDSGRTEQLPRHAVQRNRSVLLPVLIPAAALTAAVLTGALLWPGETDSVSDVAQPLESVPPGTTITTPTLTTTATGMDPGEATGAPSAEPSAAPTTSSVPPPAPAVTAPGPDVTVTTGSVTGLVRGPDGNLIPASELPPSEPAPAPTASSTARPAGDQPVPPPAVITVPGPSTSFSGGCAAGYVEAGTFDNGARRVEIQVRGSADEWEIRWRYDDDTRVLGIDGARLRDDSPPGYRARSSRDLPTVVVLAVTGGRGDIPNATCRER